MIDMGSPSPLLDFHRDDQISKHHTFHADEVSELRREVTRTHDTAENERTKRIRSQAQEDAVGSVLFCVVWCGWVGCVL